MNKEEAINEIKYAKSFGTSGIVPRWKAIDTVLNYIEELENRLKEKENIVKKSSLEAQKYFDMLMEVEYGRNTIPKQKVRDKIEELEKHRKDYEEEYSIDLDYMYDMNAMNREIQVLKEILGEDEK